VVSLQQAVSDRRRFTARVAPQTINPATAEKTVDGSGTAVAAKGVVVPVVDEIRSPKDASLGLLS
jgi:hypothetical protein